MAKQLLLLLLISLQLSAQSLDQQQTKIDNLTYYSPRFYQVVGQTFTVGISGSLTKITLQVGNPLSRPGSSLPYETKLGIYATDNSGLPLLNQELTSTTAQVDTVATHDFTFSSPAAVMAGTKYAFVISTTATSAGSGLFNPASAVAQSDVYAGGSFFRQPVRGTLRLDPTQDLYFKTYVTAAPLPVGLISFTASALPDRSVRTSWSTSWERNNQAFVVERSKDLLTFEPVAKLTDVAATKQGTTTYQWVDANPYHGTSYYRLRQIDRDGSSQTFKAVSVVVGASYGVYPNPLLHEGLTLELDEPTQAQIELISPAGAELPISRSAVTDTSVRIRPTTSLSTGVYLLKVTERGSTRTHRLVVP